MSTYQNIFTFLRVYTILAKYPSPFKQCFCGNLFLLAHAVIGGNVALIKRLVLVLEDSLMPLLLKHDPSLELRKKGFLVHEES